MSDHELATFGGGCFWCVEAVFQALEGVESVTSGYAGGHVEDPTYEAVCSGRTCHAEVVQVEYAPEVVSYRDLLEVFFAIHDPTTEDREGPDVGSQYRSAVYYHDDAQREAVEAHVEELEAGEALVLLKNKRRRQAIVSLKEQEDGRDTPDVAAEHTAARANSM
jgi:peptide-methionine (S)-S-oxide reductase